MTPLLPLLLSEERVLEALLDVIDPELGVNVVDLGLVYGVAVDGGRVTITITLTTPGCPLHASLSTAVDEAIRLMFPGVECVAVDLVWEPPWTPEHITPAGREALGWR
jgi:metal-sulfur cluster biosynthetic enzyme